MILNEAFNVQSAAKPQMISDHDKDLFRVAQELEASFVSEMLKSAGFGKSRESLAGGAGEENFSSFLIDAQAEQIVRSGGFGLAESIFEALKLREKAVD